MRQLQARKQLLARQAKQQERKARTRLLIQIGGIMARPGVDSLEKRPQVRDWLQKVIARFESPPGCQQ